MLFNILETKKNTIKITKMPQLLPFFFVNQLSFTFLSIGILVYVLSVYILPQFALQQVIRLYITKLSS